MPYYPPAATGSGIADGDKGDITVSGSGTVFNLDIKPTGAIVGTTDTQTLTNKTLTSPAINDPTLGTGGLVVTGSGSAPSTPTTGYGKITMAGTGAVRPRFINSSGTVETVITDKGSSWIAYTPSVTPTSGAFTTVSATGGYQQIANTVFFKVAITLTNNGTAAGVICSLPVTGIASTGIVAYGREDAVNGKMLQTRLTSTTTMGVLYYDNTSPNANGLLLLLTGFYEAA